MKYSVKAVTQLATFRFCEWGDGEWVETPHQEKMFDTRKEAEEFAEREKSGFAYLLKMQIVEVDDD